MVLFSQEKYCELNYFFTIESIFVRPRVVTVMKTRRIIFPVVFMNIAPTQKRNARPQMRFLIYAGLSPSSRSRK